MGFATCFPCNGGFPSDVLCPKCFGPFPSTTENGDITPHENFALKSTLEDISAAVSVSTSTEVSPQKEPNQIWQSDTPVSNDLSGTIFSSESLENSRYRFRLSSPMSMTRSANIDDMSDQGNAQNTSAKRKPGSPTKPKKIKSRKLLEQLKMPSKRSRSKSTTAEIIDISSKNPWGRKHWCCCQCRNSPYTISLRCTHVLRSGAMCAHIRCDSCKRSNALV